MSGIGVTKSNLETMSFLIIYNGHNGDLIKIPKPIRYHNLSDFKQFLNEQFYTMEVDNMFLLTSFGIKLNFNIINEINEVFVFDKRLFNNDDLVEQYNEVNKGNIDNLKLEYNQLRGKVQGQGEGQASGQRKKDIKSMTIELKQMKKSYQEILNNGLKINELINQYLKHINNIFKSLNIIFQFINNFVNDIEKSFTNHYNYIKLMNFKTLVKSWSAYYQTLKRFPSFKIGDREFKISDILNHQQLIDNANIIDEKLPIVMNKFNEMNNSIESINSDKLSIDKLIEQKRNESIRNFKNNINDEILNQMTNHVNNLTDNLDKISTGNNSQLIESVYEDAKTSETSLIELLESLNKNLQVAHDFKYDLTKSNFQVFNNISLLQMKSVEIKNDLKYLSESNSTNTKQEIISYETINQIKQCEDYLSLSIDLPLIFGFILIEKRRQFEWYDFYSKGIVNNITEQLVTIIDHEKSFQKLWLRKFGTFINLINDSQQVLKPSLPNLDITLLNNHTQNIFQVLNDIEIERSDVLQYIKIVETYEFTIDKPGKFSNLLNTNFKDLIKSTNNMKSVVKLVTSISTYTSPNNDLSNSKLTKLIANNEDNQFNENLIKGLKVRIKKLEDLLHQQQFKNISNWPVKNYTNSFSPIMKNGFDLSTSSGETAAELKEPISNTKDPSLSSSNPTKLLGKTKPMDASITIDKHLENIRLKKENKQLKDSVDSKDQEIIKLQEELRSLRNENSRVESHVEEWEKKYQDLINQNSNTNTLIKEYKLINESKDTKIIDLTNQIQENKHEIKDLNNLKQDLISNMSSKQLEYTNQCKNLEEEIKVKDQRIDQLVEDYENLIELTTKNSNTNNDTINEMNSALITLFKSLKRSINLNYDFFIEFCSILESIGLLLVKEYNQDSKQDEYKITRVKGLRSKHDESLIVEPSSKVIGDIQQLMNWIDELDIKVDIDSAEGDAAEIKSLSTNLEEEDTKQIMKVYNSIFTSSKFETFIDVISFKDDKNSIDNFFFNGICKRFRDVEGFAKKLTKENKAKIQELSKLQKNLSNKLSMNNFQIGDLVLFLPTRIDKIQSDEKESQRPWAAFNIGSPHYFLRDSIDLQDKEWVVGKVNEIQQFKVDDDNINNEELNPFQLSMGITWYLVDAEMT